MSEEREPRIPIRDKRVGSSQPPAKSAPGGRGDAEAGESDRKAAQGEETADAAAEQNSEVRVVEINKDYLADLQRLQAEFENYRKQMIRRQTELTERASLDLVKRLLPAIDHFQLAAEHGEAGPGIRLAIKELMEILGAEGLEEVQAEGKPFDYNVHEAVETHDDPDVSVETVVEVRRRGYTFRDKLVRAPYVVVAKPAPKENDLESGSVEKEEGTG
jgi:molecular chaperone GrpE